MIHFLIGVLTVEPTKSVYVPWASTWIIVPLPLLEPHLGSGNYVP